MYMQYVNRIRRCSAKHLSLAGSWVKAAMCATHYLSERKERSCTLWFLFLQQHQNINSGTLGAHWKMKWAAAFPFATQRKIMPRFFGLIWSISSLEKAFSPGKFSFVRCQEAVAGEEGCCPGGHAGKNWVSRVEYPYGSPSSSCLRSGARHPTWVTGEALSPKRMMSSPHYFITVSYQTELLIFWLIVLFYCSSAVWHIAGFCHWCLFWKTDFYTASGFHSGNYSKWPSNTLCSEY